MGCIESKRRDRASEISRLLTGEIESDFALKRQEINALVVGTKYSDKERLIKELIRFVEQQTEAKGEDKSIDGPQTNIICNDITEICFTICERKFRVLQLTDGVKAFKSKWIPYLDDVNVILFVVDIAQYNIHASERDPDENYLLDSLNLYEAAGNHYCFRKIPILLLFVNQDVLEKKLSKVPFSSGFPEFKGTDTFDEASAYILTRFETSRIWKDKRNVENIFIKSCHDTDDLLSIIHTIIDMCPLENAQVEGVNQPQQSSICDEPFIDVCLIALWYCLYCCGGPTRSRRHRR